MNLFKLFSKKNPKTDVALAIDNGEKAGTSIRTDIEECVDSIVLSAGIRYIDVLIERLKTIYDNPGDDPELCAQAEGVIFAENVESHKTNLFNQCDSALFRWRETCERIGNVKEFEECIKNRIDLGVSEIIYKSQQMVNSAIAEVRSKKN